MTDRGNFFTLNIKDNKFVYFLYRNGDALDRILNSTKALGIVVFYIVPDSITKLFYLTDQA